MKKAKLKINTNFSARNLKKGSVIEIDVDKDNIPLDIYWRRRLKDSAIDQCVELVTNNSKKVK